MRNRNHRYVHVALTAIAAISVSGSVARAQTEKVLYSFKGGSDGAEPYAGLIADSKGNGYGTTLEGGGSPNCNGGCGTVYKINASGEKVLHAFTGGPNDGANPYGGLVMDKSGNLYGTTAGGGANATGTVFKVTPSGGETILWSFGAPGSGDGHSPLGSLAIDSQGNLYGTTSAGGAHNFGTIFKIAVSGVESVLYSFIGEPMDGSDPIDGPILDKAGNLFGTTYSGGNLTYGTVWQFSKSETESVLHSFKGFSEEDGNGPQSSVALDAKGNLYGTTQTGGKFAVGTVFEVTPSTGVEKILHSFSSAGKDGFLPYAGVILDANDNIYGTTPFGGSLGAGVVYSLTPAGVETILHNFGASGDGATSYGSLLRDSKGDLYGTTEAGGKYGYGTIFEVIPQ